LAVVDPLYLYTPENGGIRGFSMSTLKIISKLIKIWLVGIVIGAVVVVLLTKVFHLPAKDITTNPLLGHWRNW